MTLFDLYKIAPKELAQTHRWYGTSIYKDAITHLFNVIQQDGSKSLDYICLWVDNNKSISETRWTKPFHIEKLKDAIDRRPPVHYDLWAVATESSDINAILDGIGTTVVEQRKQVRKDPRNRKAHKNKGRFLIMQRDGFRCQICGCDASDGVKLEIDHKYPKSKGGTDHPSNLWTLCKPCNRSKGTKLL